jgi:hypothetical protein
MKSHLNQILVEHLNENNSVNYLSLQNIAQFKQSFCKYLQEQLHITEDNLDESYRRWCNQLSSGRSFQETRRFAVYILWYRCEFKQYSIAQLLGVSTRTIRRDMRVIEKQIFH